MVFYNLIKRFDNIQNKIIQDHLENLKTLDISLNYTLTLLNEDYENINLNDYNNLKKHKHILLNLILMTLNQLQTDLEYQIKLYDTYNINLIFKSKTNTLFLLEKIKFFNYNINSDKNKFNSTKNFINYLFDIIQ